MKTTATGIMSAGLVSQFPGLAFGAKNYTFGSASATGSWYPLAVAMAKIINDNVRGYNVTGVTTPGASRENILRIDRQEMELGWSSANILYKGYMGLDPFKEKNKVLGWFAAYPGYFTIAAGKPAGIKTIADLKGKKVATGTPGSQTQMDNQNLIFPNCGLIPGKDFKQEISASRTRCRKWWTATWTPVRILWGSGVPGFVQLADSVKLNFLSLPPEAEKKLSSRIPPILSENYRQIRTGELRSRLKLPGWPIPRSAGHFLDDEFMYQATKAVFENLNFIVNASANFKHTKLECVQRNADSRASGSRQIFQGKRNTK